MAFKLASSKTMQNKSILFSCNINIIKTFLFAINPLFTAVLFVNTEKLYFFFYMSLQFRPLHIPIRSYVLYSGLIRISYYENVFKTSRDFFLANLEYLTKIIKYCWKLTSRYVYVMETKVIERNNSISHLSFLFLLFNIYMKTNVY